MLVYTYPSASNTACKRTSRFLEHFDLDSNFNYYSNFDDGVDMLQTPSEIEDAALFLECLSLQDGGYSDAGIVLEDEIGARIGEFERSGVMGAGGLGGRGEFGEGDGIDAALYSGVTAVSCPPASSATPQSYSFTDDNDSQEEEDYGDEKRGNTTSYLGYLDSLGLSAWHPNIPHTACDIFLLDE